MIIAGTGTKSGKTTLACRLIEQFSLLQPVAVKITPHFHETTPGLDLIDKGKGYAVYMEKNPELTKDTSRMLSSGAHAVFFAKVNDVTLFEAFKKIMGKIEGAPPIICESPALRHYVEPGLFIIMSSNTVYKYKDISTLEYLPHVSLKLEEVRDMSAIPVDFISGKWIYKG
jgi:molybdopterin-guanine dinucleotide biosynthesis protein